MGEQERYRIIQQLVDEVRHMHPDGKKWLQSLWRERYGYKDALASLEEMARELAIERNLINI